jgi:hypothetical protein
MDRENRASIADLTYRNRYEDWTISQAETAIGANYSEDTLNRRLKELRVEHSKNKDAAAAFSRMTAEQVRSCLLRLLRKQVASELDLPAYEEWLSINGQGVLFDA